MPDIWMPVMGPMGLDGNMCPVICPTTCTPDMMTCPVGADPNGNWMYDHNI